jgi:hypothetical protein
MREAEVTVTDLINTVLNVPLSRRRRVIGQRDDRRGHPGGIAGVAEKHPNSLPTFVEFVFFPEMTRNPGGSALRTTQCLRKKRLCRVKLPAPTQRPRGLNRRNNNAIKAEHLPNLFGSRFGGRFASYPGIEASIPKLSCHPSRTFLTFE